MTGYWYKVSSNYIYVYLDIFIFICWYLYSTGGGKGGNNIYVSKYGDVGNGQEP